MSNPENIVNIERKRSSRWIFSKRLFRILIFLIVAYILSLLLVLWRFHHHDYQLFSKDETTQRRNRDQLLRQMYFRNVLSELCNKNRHLSLDSRVCASLLVVEANLKSGSSQTPTALDLREPLLCESSSATLENCDFLLYETMKSKLAVLSWYNIFNLVDEISDLRNRLRSKASSVPIAYRCNLPTIWLLENEKREVDPELLLTFFYQLSRLITSEHLLVLFQIEGSKVESEFFLKLFLDYSHSQINGVNRISPFQTLRLSKLCNKYINTRKYHEECFPAPAKLYPVLITGLGGSGTHFLARELNHLGFHLSHEDIGADGAVVRSSLL